MLRKKSRAPSAMISKLLKSLLISFVQNGLKSIETLLRYRIRYLKVIYDRIMNEILQMPNLFPDVLDIAIRQ
jgi:hypothetical protein